jgi:hypothetical protein
MSNFAEACGVVVPIPVWAKICIENNTPTKTKRLLFIDLFKFTNQIY